MPWVSNLNPVSTSSVDRAEKSHQKPRISQPTIKIDFISATLAETALLIGKVEKQQLKEMKTIHTFPFNGEGSSERHQGKGMGSF